MIGESHLFVAVGAAIFVGAKHLGDDIWNITGIYMSKCFAQPPRIICVNDFCSPDWGTCDRILVAGLGEAFGYYISRLFLGFLPECFAPTGILG
jgi:hypothetical protein